MTAATRDPAQYLMGDHARLSRALGAFCGSRKPASPESITDVREWVVGRAAAYTLPMRSRITSMTTTIPSPPEG
jgi:hypothetical protein